MKLYWVRLFGLLALGILGGCVAAGLAAYKVAGPPAIQPKYVPSARPTVVLVDDYRRSTTLTDDDLLSRCIERQLRDHLRATPLIDSIQVRELKLNKPDAFAAMSVASIGRAVGADQIIWVDVTESSTEAILGGEQIRGTVAARVKVVDAKDGHTLWPGDMAEGYPLSFAVNWGTTAPRSDEQVNEALIQGLGDRVAKLFYKWQPDEDEPEGLSMIR